MLRSISRPGPATGWRGAFARLTRLGTGRALAALMGFASLTPVDAGAAQSAGIPPARGEQATRRKTEVVNLDTLISRALVVHPAIRAASSRVEAARARVSPAGVWPDPTLMAGIQNLPVSRERGAPADPHGTQAPSPGGPDPMTMRMVGVGQMIPYPGKLSLQRRVAEREVMATEASLDATRRRIVRDVRAAYYELAFIDRALEIVERNHRVLVSLIRGTEERYGVGTAGQQDLLKARVEASRLAETAVSLTEQRRTALARLNALLDRPSETPIDRTTIPALVVRAALGDSANETRFVSAALGARAADSPLLALLELQEIAVRENPELREHEAMIAMQAARVDLARRDALPDFDVSVQYGQRSGHPDMVTATVSIPVPIHRGRKQDQVVTATASELAALQAEHLEKQNEIRADVARLVADLERSRAQLALYTKSVLPLSRASLASATASYQVGRIEFLTVLDDQATLFTYESEYFRALTDFAKTLTELELVVGEEVLR